MLPRRDGALEERLERDPREGGIARHIRLDAREHPFEDTAHRRLRCGGEAQAHQVTNAVSALVGVAGERELPLGHPDDVVRLSGALVVRLQQRNGALLRGGERLRRGGLGRVRRGRRVRSDALEQLGHLRDGDGVPQHLLEDGDRPIGLPQVQPERGDPVQELAVLEAHASAAGVRRGAR